MDDIVSLIIAEGLWAALFCGLLVYELRDSRRRESRYCSTIKTLADRLGTVNEVKTDTTELISDAGAIKADTEAIRYSVGARSGAIETEEASVGASGS